MCCFFKNEFRKRYTITPLCYVATMCDFFFENDSRLPPCFVSWSCHIKRRNCRTSSRSRQALWKQTCQIEQEETNTTKSLFNERISFGWWTCDRGETSLHVIYFANTYRLSNVCFLREDPSETTRVKTLSVLNDMGKVRWMQVHDGLLYSLTENKLTSWNIETSSVCRTVTPWCENCHCFAVTEDKLLLSGQKSVNVYNLKTEGLLYSLSNQFSEMRCIKVQGDVFCTSSWDGFVKLWNLHDGRQITYLQGHQNPIYCMDVYSDLTRITTGSRYVFIT